MDTIQKQNANKPVLQCLLSRGRGMEMKENSKSEKRAGLSKLPQLRLRYRLLLYLLMFLFAAPSLIGTAFKCFPYVGEMVVYLLAAVTLCAGSCYLVKDIRYGIKAILKPSITANPYASRVISDYRLRTVLFAVPGLASNILFAAFNGVTGILSRSAWFGSLSAYYILLSMMRAMGVGQEKKISKITQEKERMRQEIATKRKNSQLFILMAIVLGGMVILLESSIGGKNYPGFTIYAAALYAFYRIITSVINMVKVNKQKSPLLTIIRKIGYIDACVSMLTLQTAMFTSFAKGQERQVKWMNGITGIVVCIMVFAIGIQGICASGNMIKQLEMGGNGDDSDTCSRG